MICDKCGVEYGIGQFPFCKGGHGTYAVAVIDDELEGGPRRFDTMGHDSPYIASKSQWKREILARGLVNVDKHDSAYYAKQRKAHDERLRDTGAKA